MEQLFTSRQAGYEIKALAILANKDLLVHLLGGDLPHLGGVVTYDRAAGQETAVKFASHDGRLHKDILLAQLFAKEVVQQLPGNLCVTAGVHIDGIKKEQIAASQPMTQDLARQVLAWVKEQEGSFKDPSYTTHLK